MQLTHKRALFNVKRRDNYQPHNGMAVGLATVYLGRDDYLRYLFLPLEAFQKYLYLPHKLQCIINDEIK